MNVASMPLADAVGGVDDLTRQWAMLLDHLRPDRDVFVT
jgi:hypothetical protein